MTLQDLGRRGLPLERLLGLVEQAHVLDRDHRLVARRSAAARSGCDVNWPGLAPADVSMPIEAPSRRSGRTMLDAQRVRAAPLLEYWVRVLGACRRSSPAPDRGCALPWRAAVDRPGPRRQRGVAAGRGPPVTHQVQLLAAKRAPAPCCRRAARVARSPRSRRTPAARRSASRDDLAGSRPSPSAARAPPCVSLSRRTFSIAITAWSAKVRISSIWRVDVCPASGQPTRIAPTATPSLSIGAPHDAPPRARGGEGVVVGRVASARRRATAPSRVRIARPASGHGRRARGYIACAIARAFAGQLRVATRLTTRPS